MSYFSSAQNSSVAHHFIGVKAKVLSMVYKTLFGQATNYLASFFLVAFSHLASVTLTSLPFLQCMGISHLQTIAPTLLILEMFFTQITA